MTVMPQSYISKSTTLFTGVNRIEQETNLLYKTFFKSASPEVLELLSSCSSTGYKIKNVGSEIALFSNLNLEVARFNSAGSKLISTIYQNSIAGTKLATLEREILYSINGKEKSGLLELVKDNNSNFVWREVVNTAEVGKVAVPFEYFKTSVNEFTTNDDLAKEAFELYKQEKWGELEAFFKTKKLNGQILPDGSIVYWPPANGGYGMATVSLIKGMRFDRYQKTVRNIVNDKPEFIGSYTSPIESGKTFDFASRALEGSEDSYDLFYEIEVLKDLPFKGEQAKVIPWHGYKGNGVQTQFKFPDNSWNLGNLQRDGYIKITIKSSPSGKYDVLSGNTIKPRK